MSLLFFTLGGGTPTGVQLLANNFRTFGIGGAVYSGVKFAADGGVYERQSGGGWSRVFTWLLTGTNSDFYVVRTIATGGLTTDAGAGQQQLDADIEFDVQQVGVGQAVAGVYFEIQNVGTTVLASISYDFDAEVGSDL